jgi:hypothetical protein
MKTNLPRKIGNNFDLNLTSTETFTLKKTHVKAMKEKWYILSTGAGSRSEIDKIYGMG